MAAFFYGYCACQIPGSVAVRRHGARAVLTVCIAAWCVLTAATPPAARWGPKALVTVRVLLGVAEAPVGPAATHLVAHWAPAHERSRGQAVVGFGFFLGTVAALAISPALMVRDFRGPISTIWTALSWMRVGTHRRRVPPSPGCAWHWPMWC